MKVIGQQAKRVNLPVRLRARLAKGGQENLPVHVVRKYGLPPVAAIHHMIDRLFIFHFHLARHGAKTTTPLELCQ